MKLLLTLIFAIFLAQSLPLHEDSSGPYWSSNTWERNDFRDEIAGIEGRFKRNTAPDNLKVPLERLLMIARITTGILLCLRIQSEASTNMDDIISELVVFGPAKQSEIVKIDPNTFGDDLDKLAGQKLHQKDSAGQAAEKVWQAVGKIFKAIDGDTNLTNWDVNGFKQEIQKLSRTDTVLKAFDELLKYDSTFTSAMDMLTGTNANSSPKQSFTTVKEVMKAVQSLKSFQYAFWKFQKFLTASDGLSPILKFQEASTHFGSLKKVTSKQSSSYIDFFKTTAENQAPLKAVQQDLKSVKDLVTSYVTRRLGRSVTPGFLKASSDISKIFEDLKDPWVMGQMATGPLEQALMDLKDLTIPLEDIEKGLNGIGWDDVEVLNDVVAFSDHISSAANDVGRIEKAIKELDQCPLPQGQVPDATKITEIQKHLESIDDKLGATEMHTSELDALLNSPNLDTWLDDVIKICEDALKAQDLQQHIQKLKGYQNLASLKTQVGNVYAKVHEIQNVQKTSTIQADAQSVAALFKDLDTFHAAAKTQFAQTFSYLQNHQDLKFASEAYQKILKASTMQAALKLNDVKKIVKQIVANKDKLGRINGIISDMSKENKPEIAALSVLKYEDPQNVGMAIRGISNMQNTRIQKPAVDALLKNLPVIKRNLKTLTDPEDVQHLRNLLSLNSEIQNMYNSLDVFNAAVKNDVDAKAMFQLASKVTGVSGDFLKMSYAVKKLNTPQKVTSDNVESSLKTMETMGLDFVSYGFTEAQTSMDAIDMFFSQYTGVLPETSTLPPKEQQMLEESSTTVLAPSESSFFDKFPIWAIVLVCVFVACLITVGAMYLFCRPKLWVICKFFLCCKKKKNESIINAGKSVKKSKRGTSAKGKKDLVKLLENTIGRIRDQITECKNNNPMLWKDEKDWPLVLAAFYVTIFNGDFKSIPRIDAKLFGKKRERDCRMHLDMIETRRVKLAGYQNRFVYDYYPASFYTLPDGKVLILAQCPQIASGEDKDLNRKRLNIPQFWYMARQEKTKNIVMLCSLTEQFRCANKNKPAKEVKMSDLYFPREKDEVMTFNVFELKCLEVTIDKQACLETRKISVKFEEEEPFVVTHRWFTDWRDRRMTARYDTLVSIWNALKVEKDEKPIICCSDGANRTAAFTFGIHLYQRRLLEEDVRTLFEMRPCLAEFTAQRPSGLVNPRNYATAAYFCMTLLNDGIDLKSKTERKMYAEMGEWTLEFNHYWKRYQLLKEGREMSSLQLTDEFAHPASKAGPANSQMNIVINKNRDEEVESETAGETKNGEEKVEEVKEEADASKPTKDDSAPKPVVIESIPDKEDGSTSKPSEDGSNPKKADGSKPKKADNSKHKPPGDGSNPKPPADGSIPDDMKTAQE